MAGYGKDVSPPAGLQPTPYGTGSGPKPYGTEAEPTLPYGKPVDPVPYPAAAGPYPAAASGKVPYGKPVDPGTYPAAAGPYPVAVPGEVPYGKPVDPETYPAAAGPYPAAASGKVPYGKPVDPGTYPAAAGPYPAAAPGEVPYGKPVDPGTYPGKCALEYFECAKCFGALHERPLSVFVSGGKRTCTHFLHTQCCDTSMKTCPTCSIPFTELKPVPSVVDDANGWFKAVDTDGNGTLDKEEAFAALASALPAAPGMKKKEALKNEVDEKWKQWDSDGDGKITCDENMTAVTGLRDFVLAKLKEAAPRPGSVYAIEPAQLPLELTCRVSPAEYQDYQDQKKAWFQHWDKDKSNSLDREEIVRAIVKTFNMSSASGYSDALLLGRLQSIREHLEVVWNLDAKGEDVIKLEDFLIPRDGLGDSIIASVKAWTDRS